MHSIVHFLETDQGNQKKMCCIQTLGPHGQLHRAAAFRADADSSANTGAKQDVPGRKLTDYKCYVVS